MRLREACRGQALAILICAGTAGAQDGEPRGRERVDAVAAVVERRVVTTSEMYAEARLALLERAGAAVAAGPLDVALLHKVLDSIVVQELLALEARRTGISVRESEIDKAVDAVRARFALGQPNDGAEADPARVFFERFGIDEELLRTRARRDLAAQALLQKVIAEAQVADDDANAVALAKPANEPLTAARTAVASEPRNARLHALLDGIRSVTEVRVVWRP